MFHYFDEISTEDNQNYPSCLNNISDSCEFITFGNDE